MFQLVQTTVHTKEDYTIYIAVAGVLGVLMCGTTYFFDFEWEVKTNNEPINKSERLISQHKPSEKEY